MPLPPVTHLQFMILNCLTNGELPGRDLRSTLEEEGVSQSRAAFYQLMSRLEDSGFVIGRSEQRVVDDITVTERIYSLAVPGKEVIHRTIEFYKRASSPPSLAII